MSACLLIVHHMQAKPKDIPHPIDTKPKDELSKKQLKKKRERELAAQEKVFFRAMTNSPMHAHTLPHNCARIDTERVPSLFFIQRTFGMYTQVHLRRIYLVVGLTDGLTMSTCAGLGAQGTGGGRD
jgi:hypothetical protein